MSPFQHTRKNKAVKLTRTPTVLMRVNEEHSRRHESDKPPLGDNFFTQHWRRIVTLNRLTRELRKNQRLTIITSHHSTDTYVGVHIVVGGGSLHCLLIYSREYDNTPKNHTRTSHLESLSEQKRLIDEPTVGFTKNATEKTSWMSKLDYVDSFAHQNVFDHIGTGIWTHCNMSNN